MSEPHPTKDLKKVLKLWQRLKDEVQDTECGGETFEFLSEWSPETGTAQHALWRGCESISKICREINEELNMAYPHPMECCTAPKQGDAEQHASMSKCEICGVLKSQNLCGSGHSINCIHAGNIPDKTDDRIQKKIEELETLFMTYRKNGITLHDKGVAEGIELAIALLQKE